MKKTYIRPEITTVTLDREELMLSSKVITSSSLSIKTLSYEADEDEGAFSKGNTWFDDEDEEDW